jgi:hypothetical protein
MKKMFGLMFFIGCSVFLNALDIPRPQNDQLYTEFIAHRHAAYLKKPLVSEGIIVLDGQERFLYRQNVPFLIVIKKMGKSVTYQKGSAAPYTVGEVQHDIMVLFEKSDKLTEKYDVTVVKRENDHLYTIIPKLKGDVQRILLTAVIDEVKSLELVFADQSRLVYYFKNTVTGKKPDEKLFE